MIKYIYINEQLDSKKKKQDVCAVEHKKSINSIAGYDDFSFFLSFLLFISVFLLNITSVEVTE